MWAKIKRWFYKLIGRKSKVDEVFGIEIKNSNGVTTLSLDSETQFIGAPFSVNIKLNALQSKSVDLSAYGDVIIVHSVDSPNSVSVSFNASTKKITATAVGQFGGSVLVKGVGVV